MNRGEPSRHARPTATETAGLAQHPRRSLRGNEVRDVSVIPKLFADFAGQGETEIWNIQISDKIVAPVMRQTVKRGHGVM